MIKKFNLSKLDPVMKIWIDANIDAHNFIQKEYWINNYDLVKQMLPLADIYIFEENNIAGLFVKKEYQREGIGQKLIDYCKSKYLLLKLDVFIKNKNAVSFYYKNGFKVLDEHFSEEVNEIEYTMLFGNK